MTRKTFLPLAKTVSIYENSDFFKTDEKNFFFQKKIYLDFEKIGKKKNFENTKNLFEKYLISDSFQMKDENLDLEDSGQK